MIGLEDAVEDAILKDQVWEDQVREDRGWY